MKRLAPLALALLGACTPHISGLMPLEPEPEGWTDSLHPRFRWEPLPGAQDPRITELVYDLRISRPSGELIAAREGLTSCEYRVEKPLQQNSRYLWSVRARFRWEGRRRLTEWSHLATDGERLALVPALKLHDLPFWTPAEAVRKQ